MIIADIVRQHADEAAFLWTLRGRAIESAAYSLEDLAIHDERIEAHLDGLRIAGDEASPFCDEQLSAKETGGIFAAAIHALESGQQERLARVGSSVEQEPMLIDGLVSALAWIPSKEARSEMERLLLGKNSVQQRVGVAAAAVQRRPLGELAFGFLKAADPNLRARTLKAMGQLGDRSLIPRMHDALQDPDSECRFAAAWSGALLGVSTATAVLSEIAVSDSPRALAAADCALRRMELTAALSWQKRLAGNPKRLRLAILGAGILGDPESVPWLIPLMAQPGAARLAGKAFTVITGADLAMAKLDYKAPDHFNAGPNEDPNDDNVVMDPDEDLPWPAAPLVEKWWAQHRAEFRPGVRYFLGKPITIEWLQHVLRTGCQPHRSAAALELAIRQPGTPIFNVAAPGFRQQELLGLKKKWH